MIYITQAFRESKPLTTKRVVALMQGHNGSATYVTDDWGNRFLVFRKHVYPIRECAECGTLIIGETARYCDACLPTILKADDAYYNIEGCVAMLGYFMSEHLGESARNGSHDALESLAQWADELTVQGGGELRQRKKGMRQ